MAKKDKVFIPNSVITKEICVWCHNKQRWGWSDRDDRRWADGNITCATLMRLMKITDGIPETCPYHLEHTVNKGQENENQVGVRK